MRSALSPAYGQWGYECGDLHGDVLHELARLRADRERVIDLRRLVDHARSALRNSSRPTPTTRRDGRELGYDDETDPNRMNNIRT